MTDRIAMITDDEMFVVLDVEDALYAAGIRVGASLTSNAAALEWLETHRPDVAVLDYRLRDGTSEVLAEVLKSLAIPFIVYSGNSYEPELHAPTFEGVPWLDKPSDVSDLTDAILRVLPSA
jgi:DNA-binding NtrC family response regulator